MWTHPRLAVARFLGAPAALPTLVALLLAALLLTGCGTAGPAGTGTGTGTGTGSDIGTGKGEEPSMTEPTPSDSFPTAVPAADGEVTGSGLVMDRGRPEFCLGAIGLSLPPQCSGPPITNWDWDAVDPGSFQRRGGVRWGDYTLVGTFDGKAFTLTRPPSTELPEPPEEEDRLGTPCPPPTGGWKPVDPDRTTDTSMQTTLRRAEQLEGYAGAWLDQSINPAAGRTDEESSSLMNDPRKLVLNVAVTGDRQAAESILRETWGGALCVSAASYTEAELQRIQHRAMKLPGPHFASSGHDRVEVGVLYDDGSLQAWADREYGAGLVRISSALSPVE